MRKWIIGIVAGVVATGALAGCSGTTSQVQKEQSYKDGTYTAQSSPDERGAVGEVTLVISNGKISKAEYKGIMKDGTVKGSDYGKTNGKIENQEFYNKAQRALRGTATYAPELVKTQAVDKIDAVSGATVSYNQFAEATEKALKAAGKIDAVGSASVSLEQKFKDAIKKIFQ